MSGKAHNEAPHAQGSSLTTAITGETPHLLFGDNRCVNSAITARARAVHAAPAAMKKHSGANILCGRARRVDVIDWKHIIPAPGKNLSRSCGA